jgi:hypothetical protein
MSLSKLIIIIITFFLNVGAILINEGAILYEGDFDKCRGDLTRYHNNLIKQ